MTRVFGASNEDNKTSDIYSASTASEIIENLISKYHSNVSTLSRSEVHQKAVALTGLPVIDHDQTTGNPLKENAHVNFCPWS